MSIPTDEIKPETNVHLPPPLPHGESAWFEYEDDEYEYEDEEYEYEDGEDDESLYDFEPELYYDADLNEYCYQVVLQFN